MKLSRLIIPILVGLLLTVGTLAAYASGRGAPATPPVFHASESNLPPASFADHIAADATGRLWITEALSRTLMQFDPVTHVYTSYTVLTPTQQAQLGPDGQLWWLGGPSIRNVYRLNLGNDLATTWPISVPSLTALAFDSQQRAWAASYLSAGLYRLDLGRNEACDMDLPDGGATLAIAADQGALWVGDNINKRIGRIDPATNSFTYWPLAFAGGFPFVYDLTFAPNGDVYWADGGLNRVGRLEPGTNTITLYGPTSLGFVGQVTYSGGKLWFTEPFSSSLGYIDPAVAAGSGPHVVTPLTGTLASSCGSVNPGPTFAANVSSGVSSFSGAAYSSTQTGAEGTLFLMAPGSDPTGLAAIGFNLYAIDAGRDKLIASDTAAAHLFLPLATR